MLLGVVIKGAALAVALWVFRIATRRSLEFATTKRLQQQPGNLNKWLKMFCNVQCAKTKQRTTAAAQPKKHKETASAALGRPPQTGSSCKGAPLQRDEFGIFWPQPTATICRRLFSLFSSPNVVRLALRHGGIMLPSLASCVSFASALCCSHSAVQCGPSLASSRLPQPFAVLTAPFNAGLKSTPRSKIFMSDVKSSYFGGDECAPLKR